MKPGTVFFALRGVNADGARFVPQAIANGAIAVVAETAAPAGIAVPWIQVPSARAALAEMAAAFYGNPSEELALVGITGTNGKTTTSYVLSSIFEAAGIKCGRIGTIGYRVGGREVDAARTTPEAPELQRMLRDMVKEGCGACVMEVSSHALALRRADELRFAAGIFTNLTRDHLDFHGDMESYFAAKRRLFEILPDGAVGVINVDDRRGADLAAAARRPVTYAIDAAADVRPGPLTFSLDGLSFDVRTPRGTFHVRSPLVGRPNAYNILAASAAAMALDVPFSAIEAGVSNLENVPGRFQVVSDAADDVRVIVDYAHTDDALKNLLETARPLATGRLVTVFGCGGDRDRTKRPLMGAVAARLSDLVIVTSDNPRQRGPREDHRGDPARHRHAGGSDRAEGPEAARRRSRSSIGARRSSGRSARRRAAISMLIAGKGHEKYQVIGDRTLPFDDVEVARAALARRRSGSRVTLRRGGAGCAQRRRDRRRDRRPGGRRGRPRSARRTVVDRHAVVAPGDLFVAVRGDRFDGHDFVAAALAAGAAGAVVTATPALPEAGKAGPAPLAIEVADTTRALQDGAREVRRRSGAKVVAITGSAGKTTTKELTAEFLAAKYHGVSEQGQLEQSHRPAALAAGAARQAGGGGGRTGHESRRGNQHAGRHRRAGGARLDQRRRRARGLLRVRRRHRRRQGGDPRAGAARRSCSSPMRTTRAIRARAGRFAGTDPDFRHIGRCGVPRQWRRSIAASTAWRRTVTTPPGEAVVETPLLGTRQSR